MKETKKDFYQKLIDNQKQFGQGMVGSIRVNSKYEVFIEQLLKEGKIIEENCGLTIGDPLSNIFYLPSKGYNVWKDKNKYALTYIRHYLGVQDDLAIKHNFQIDQTDYQEWLDVNQSEIDVMLNIQNDIVEKTYVLKDDAIAFLKKRKDKTVGDVIDFLFKIKSDNEEKIDINYRLIDLYNLSRTLNINKIYDVEKELAKDIRYKEMCDEILLMLSELDENENISKIYFNDMNSEKKNK